MPRIDGKLERGDYNGPFSDFRRGAIQRMERAALVATDRAAQIAKRTIRAEMQGANLGRLGNAIDANSDLSRGDGIKRLADGGFSASGAVFIRSKSARTRGAIESYTQGASIRPVRGRWLWIPTDEIQRLGGSGKARERLTPGNWVKFGMDRKIGPLTVIRSVNGYPLMVVKNVGVSEAGSRRSARSLTRSGRARKGQVAKEFIVAFIGIPHTARAARIDVTAIMRKVQADLPRLFNEALGRF